MPHAAEQLSCVPKLLSSHAATLKAHVPRACDLQQSPLKREAHALQEEQSPLTETRGSPSKSNDDRVKTKK